MEDTNLYRFCSFSELDRLITDKLIYPSHKEGTGFTFYTTYKIPELHKFVKRHAILCTYNGEVLRNQGAFLMHYEEAWLKKNPKVIKYLTKHDRARVLSNFPILNESIEEYFLPICLKFVPNLLKEIQIYTNLSGNYKPIAEEQINIIKEKLSNLVELKKQGQNIYFEDIHATESDNI
jgi:hypothetical protein